MTEPPESASTASVASKRQRPTGEGDDGAPLSKRSGLGGDVRTVKPGLYDGKSKQAFKEYTRQCEYTFRLAPDRYARDSTKVLYAAQFLHGETARAFERLEETNGPDNTTWEEYKVFLRDLLQDPVTCAATLARRYNDAAQWPGQTVAQFVNYLDELEAELPPYSEEHRRQHLLAKLLPELRYALNNYQNIPATRTGLIGLATQLEANLPRKSKGDGKAPASRPESAAKPNSQNESDFKGKGKPRGRLPFRHKGSSSSAPSSSKPAGARPPRRRADLTEEERDRRMKENLCFGCSKAGHRAYLCPEKKATSSSTKATENSRS